MNVLASISVEVENQERQVRGEKKNGEFLGNKDRLVEELPIHRPLEKEHAAEIKGAAHILYRVSGQAWIRQNQLRRTVKEQEK